MKKLYTLVIFTLLLVTVQRSYAGWPEGKGRYSIGTSLSAYLAKDYWDNQGNYVRGTKTFDSYSLGVSVDYGLSRRLDLLVSVPLALQVNNYKTTNRTTGGLGDLNLGLSYVLINHKFRNYTSIYGGVIAPLYSKYDSQTLGLGMFGTEVKLENTGNLAFEDRKAYYNIELGYRQFYDTDGPRQFTYLAALGYKLDADNQIIIDVSGVDSRSADKGTIIFSGAARDYRVTRSSLTYGHMFSRKVSVFASGFYTLTARNTGLGYGGTLQASFHF